VQRDQVHSHVDESFVPASSRVPGLRCRNSGGGRHEDSVLMAPATSGHVINVFGLLGQAQVSSAFARSRAKNGSV